MADQQNVTINLSDKALALFTEYQRFTGTSPEAYIEALVDKTLPTLNALVEAMHEASDDSDAVMELFGRKMAESMLQQPDQAAAVSAG